MGIFDIRKISSATDTHFPNAWKLLKNTVLGRRKFISALTAQECNGFIAQNLDLLFFNFGLDRFRGWVKFGFFSVSLICGGFDIKKPVIQKAIGRISVRNGRTIVSVKIYKGLTDLLSLLQIFLISFVFLGGITSEFDLIKLSLQSLLICVIIAILTYIITFNSEEARENEEELLDFLIRSMDLTKLD